jgi:hypothetical protein
MTRRPPTILGVWSSADGGFEVRWEVDQFFADSAEPEKVRIDLNGVQFDVLDGDEVSVEVPAATIAALAVAVVAVSVSFLWSGSPSEEQQSSVTVAVQSGAISGNAGVLPALKPVVTLVSVQPRTAGTPSSITIAWKSNNYNDGNILWGPSDAQRRFRRNVRPPNDSVNSGVFTTDQPLIGGTPYFFTVEVRNTLHSPTWISTTVMVRSATDTPARTITFSVRQFLQTSGRPVTSSLAPLVGPARSVRKMLLGES